MTPITQSIAKRVVLKAYLAGTVTAATGKTIPVVISKNGAAFANPSAGATNATEIASGWYYVDLSTTDTATLGPLVVRGTEGTIDATEIAFSVEAASAGSGLTVDAIADEVETRTNSALTTTITAVNTNVEASLNSTLADSVPADGTRPTLRQALYMTIQFLTERVVSGTSVDVKKVDGSTSLFGLTLNSSTNPTSITRSS